MRPLQTHQPSAVQFTYQGSPSTLKPSHPLPYRTHSIPKTFTLPHGQLSSIATLPRGAAFGDTSHIKVIDSNSPQRQRRYKIFQEQGLIKNSKSSQRDRSLCIDNGERNISKFMNTQKSEEKPSPKPQANLQRQLTQKEKELAYLKMQLQRFQRCERITHQNESIYLRLIQKIDYLRQSQQISPLQRKQQKRSARRVSPQRLSPNRQASLVQTTRFLNPSSRKQQTIINNIFNNPYQTHIPSPQGQNLHNAVTFYRQPLRKALKGNRLGIQHQISEEQLRERLQQSVLRYTDTVSFDEVPINDKLSSINRHLQNKYTLREISRPASHSIYTHRGRSIGSLTRHPLIL